ncbi:MAG: prepilin-type N-terminal cleavage/methylation domain-containing protein [Deltaproteobacteria bacterium]|nr:prepilin-type N-terminal cleavage/methylation domain-containing protein [Deltaproteobacteria bacterium]
MFTGNPKPHAEAGFTLLEVLVAMTILGIILLTVYGALSRALYTKAYAEDRAELYAAGREAVLRIADDLEAALPPRPRGDLAFHGLSHGERPPVDAVQFSRRTHSGLRPIALQSGRATVTYSLDPLGEGSKAFVLRRDEVPLMTELPEGEEDLAGDTLEALPTPKATAIYLLDPADCTEGRFCVVGLRFRHLDPITEEWVSQWDSTEKEQLNRLPAATEVALYLSDSNGAVHDFSTVVDLVLAAASIPTPTVAPSRRGGP